MKAYVIYVKGHKLSEKYADNCFNSAKDSGFEPEMFEGVTPATLDQWTHMQYPDLPNGRITHFKRESPENKYKIKKSCFTNHVRLWNKCLELNEPIVVLEQDAHCVANWNPTLKWEDILILNLNSAFKQKQFNHIKLKPSFIIGKGRYDDPSALEALRYYKPSVFKGAFMMPGTAAYAVTPQGATKLLNAVKTLGWEQSDFFINSHIVTMEYILPELFSFRFENLNMSHGFNISE